MQADRRFTYHARVLDELARHGLAPKPATPPGLLREFINDLYRYELRRLRGRLLGNEFPRRELSQRVIDLRKRYGLLSIPVQDWTDDAT